MYRFKRTNSSPWETSATPPVAGTYVELTTSAAEIAACAFCQAEKARGNTFYPNHFASPRCESGGRNHCSCDTCF